MSFIRKYPEAIFTGIMVAFMAYVLIEGTDKMLRYKFFPYFCVLMIAGLLVLEWIRTIATRRNASVDIEENQLFTFSPTYKKRVLRFLVWIGVFFIGIWLVGLELAAPAFLILFLRLEAKLHWWLVLGLTAGSWAVIHYLFFFVLGLQVPDGLLF